MNMQEKYNSNLDKDTTQPIVDAASSTPAIGKELRLTQTVLDAVQASPETQALAEYFGIGGSPPLQHPSEAIQSDELIQRLKATPESGNDFSDLFKKITQHADDSMVDPDALRALMYRNKKA